jgi:hypothetical protein
VRLCYVISDLLCPLDDGVEYREDIQPDIYRAPEVILDIPWTYSVDIWNVGCMVSTVQREIIDLCQL